MHQRGNTDSGALTRNLGNPERAADLVGRFTPGKDAADIRQRAVDHEPGFLDAKPECRRRVHAFGCGIAGYHLAGNAQHADPVRISERVFHLPELRRSPQLQRAIAALDRECQRFAGANADNPLHIGETPDRSAVDCRYDVTDLKAGSRGCTPRLHLIDTRRRAWFAKEREQAGEDHDCQKEVGDWTGGHDRRTLTDFLVVETAGALFFGHAGEHFGRWRRGLAIVAEELDIAAERDGGDLPPRAMAVVETGEVRTEAE